MDLSLPPYADSPAGGVRADAARFATGNRSKRFGHDTACRIRGFRSVPSEAGKLFATTLPPFVTQDDAPVKGCLDHGGVVGGVDL